MAKVSRGNQEVRRTSVDPDCNEKIDCAHGIQQMFMYQHRKDAWLSEKITVGRSRIWNQTFHKLRKDGFIERRKTKDGFQYRWKARHPE